MLVLPVSLVACTERVKRMERISTLRNLAVLMRHGLESTWSPVPSTPALIPEKRDPLGPSVSRSPSPSQVREAARKQRVPPEHAASRAALEADDCLRPNDVHLATETLPRASPGELTGRQSWQRTRGCTAAPPFQPRGGGRRSTVARYWRQPSALGERIAVPDHRLRRPETRTSTRVHPATTESTDQTLPELSPCPLPPAGTLAAGSGS